MIRPTLTVVGPWTEADWESSHSRERRQIAKMLLQPLFKDNEALIARLQELSREVR